MIRQHGLVSSAAGLIPFAHLGWGYRDRAEFCARAAEYIADGLASNEWILYVGAGSRAALRAELAALGFGEAVKSRQILAAQPDDYYTFVPGSEVVDPEATVAKGVARFEQLLASGCPAFRAVVDGTVAAVTTKQRDALARLEYLVEKTMSVLPASALCAYDVSRLGPAAKEMICLHPVVGKGVVGFRLYPQQDAGFALAGEIDSADADAFTASLQRIWPLAPGDELIVDAYGLDFVTHRQLLELDERARAERRKVILRTDQCLVAQLVEVLELENVRVEATPIRGQ
ncbi:MAG: MEDS domain-containing protein [Mycobacterium sp.]|nr:MEDS domain-containing protein [Mycobacterium sp.]